MELRCNHFLEEKLGIVDLLRVVRVVTTPRNLYEPSRDKRADLCDDHVGDGWTFRGKTQRSRVTAGIPFTTFLKFYERLRSSLASRPIDAQLW
jgi:hypothetical protein